MISRLSKIQDSILRNVEKTRSPGIGPGTDAPRFSRPYRTDADLSPSIPGLKPRASIMPSLRDCRCVSHGQFQEIHEINASRRDALGIGHLCIVDRRSGQGRLRFRCNSMVIPALAGSPHGQRPVANRRSQAQAFYHRFRDIGGEWPIPSASRRDAARLARGFNPGCGVKPAASPVGTTEVGHGLKQPTQPRNRLHIDR